MTAQRNPSKIGRRKFLIGAGGAAAAGAAALIASCGDDEGAAPDWQGELTSKYIDEPVPVDDPSSGLWKKAKAVNVPLTPQLSFLPFRKEPAFPSVRLRSLHDGERIAFLMTWEDSQADELTIKTDQFRDSCGVLVGPGDAPPAFYMMGTLKVPASILCWRADWQKDIDAGFQDLEVAFPNAAFDFYPPLVDAERPLKISADYPQEGRPWLVGWSAGNLLSNPVKPSPVEKILGKGPGTLEHMATQDASGRGVWADGQWKVVLARDLKASNSGETAMEPGGTYALVVTAWSGAAQDRGSRKSPSAMGKLILEAVA